MKRIIVHLAGVLACLTAFAQTPATTNAPLRGRDGFLLSPAPPAATTAPQTPAPPAVTNHGATASTSVLGEYLLDDKHKLLAGDRVSFQIVEDRTNSVSLLVAESSELDIPYIGRLNVAGKTCKELASDVKNLLEKDYYHRATVIIGLDALTKVLGKVYVFGPVRTPGPVEIPANETFTAAKAILRCGGFGDFADWKNIQVIRKSESGEKKMMVNMVTVMQKGKTDEDIVLAPDDIIIVKKKWINF